MFDIKENLKKLPDTPGVYLHKDKLGQVIYVGKAVSLKNRVRQYFQSPANQSPKVRAMVSHIAEFEYITCQTEMEALILECNLIKKYAPKYNVLLRDDKTYPYIKVTLSEDYPRIVKTRRIEKDGDKYFGPYSDAGAVNQMIDLLNKIYRFKRCPASRFPESHRPCLNFHIGECRGVCTGQVSREKYRESVEDAMEFLSGHQKKLVDRLTEKMTACSEAMNYEEAAVYRDYILAAKSIGEVQRVTMVNGKDLDVVLPVRAGQTQSVVLFTVRDGKLSGRETFAMQTGAEDDYDSLIGGFIKQYYSQWAVVPGEILVERPLKEGPLIEKFLEGQGEGRKVRIFVPQRGDKKALLNLAQRDAGEMTRNLEEKVKSGEERNQALIRELEAVLGFHKESYRIESYDISNTNGVDTVGAMVVFQNLKPVRKDYRRFKIRTIEGPNDYGSLQEMLYRRFRRAEAGDPGFRTLPDVILMDGGQGQVTAAEKVLTAMKIPIPVLGMAKDDSHRTRALVNGRGEEILLSERPLLFQYCGTIQEEVHRFAIDYHRSLHNKNTIRSVLDNIRGIGPVKRNALLNHFQTVEDIKKASLEKLMEVPGITEQNAKAILEYFS
ncbi:MAG: excinuclease ABC subunit UvrC [Firmicutes bacterium]|nr:excinuclease ABC subunit UvrC [Bacillota bacterium]MDY5857009.1 excinuclease ABC subunit UvrC [Anaerovoracaceae bacterium]